MERKDVNLNGGLHSNTQSRTQKIKNNSSNSTNFSLHTNNMTEKNSDSSLITNSQNSSNNQRSIINKSSVSKIKKCLVKIPIIKSSSIKSDKGKTVININNNININISDQDKKEKKEQEKKLLFTKQNSLIITSPKNSKDNTYNNLKESSDTSNFFNKLAKFEDASSNGFFSSNDPSKCNSIILTEPNSIIAKDIGKPKILIKKIVNDKYAKSKNVSGTASDFSKMNEDKETYNIKNFSAKIKENLSKISLKYDTKTRNKVNTQGNFLTPLKTSTLKDEQSKFHTITNKIQEPNYNDSLNQFNNISSLLKKQSQATIDSGQSNIEKIQKLFEMKTFFVKKNKKTGNDNFSLNSSKTENNNHPRMSFDRRMNDKAIKKELSSIISLDESLINSKINSQNKSKDPKTPKPHSNEKSFQKN
jgi:hypothetical protein